MKIKRSDFEIFMEGSTVSVKHLRTKHEVRCSGGSYTQENRLQRCLHLLLFHRLFLPKPIPAFDAHDSTGLKQHEKDFQNGLWPIIQFDPEPRRAPHGDGEAK